MNILEKATDEFYPLYDAQEFKSQYLNSYQIPGTMEFINLHYILNFELNVISYEIRIDRDQRAIFTGTNAYLALEKFNKLKEEYENDNR